MKYCVKYNVKRTAIHNFFEKCYIKLVHEMLFEMCKILIEDMKCHVNCCKKFSSRQRNLLIYSVVN